MLSGALAHSGPTGSERVEAGQVAVLRTGAGATHAEVADAPQTRFVQVWLTAAGPEEPSYEVATPALARRAGPGGRAGPGAVFSVARLGGNQSVIIPVAPRVHVFVVRGALLRSSLAEPLHAATRSCSPANRRTS